MPDGLDLLQTSIQDLGKLMDRVLEVQTNSLKDLMAEFRLVRQAVEDTRNRVTALEGRVTAVEQEQLRVRNDSTERRTQVSSDMRTLWQLIVMAGIAAAGWVYNSLKH